MGDIGILWGVTTAIRVFHIYWSAVKLHRQVVFIGDRPNQKKNRHLDVPFVGTRSYKTLLEWFYRMDVDITRVYLVNAYTVDGAPVMLPWDALREQGTAVVVLGAAALEAVKDKDVQFFVLPHPSGLNRELNDKKKLSEKLAKCRDFIYKKD